MHPAIRLRLEAYFSANIQDASNRIQNEEIYNELLELKDHGVIMPEIGIPTVTTIKNWMSRRTRAWKDEMQKVIGWFLANR